MAMTTASERYGLWMDGQMSEAASTATFTSVSPYDGTVVAEYANGNERDAEAAILSARRAFDDRRWRDASARTRRVVLERTGTLMVQDAHRLANDLVREIGKPIAQAQAEVLHASRAFEYFAGAVLADEGEAISERNAGALGLVYYEPIGIAAMITAWNFPILQIANKTAAALAAGCSVVAKPSHLCSSPALRLARYLRQAGLPDGVFNVVTSDIERGARVGQHLAESRDVGVISFTGSTAAGRAVMRAAASNVKRVQLELGGKSANIVFADVPLEDAARSAAGAFTVFSGQQCSAGSRLLVQREIHERFVAAVVEHTRREVLGDPRSPETTMGPLISSEQLARVMDYIRLGQESGRLVLGGAQPAIDAPVNFFVEPTIVDGLSNASPLAQEEVFGPVLAVIPFDTEDEAIALANESEYGLSGAVWTRSLDRALRVTKAVRTGKFSVNCYGSAGIDDMPHGGYKSSGLGRESGRVGLREFQETKAVQIKLTDG